MTHVASKVAALVAALGCVCAAAVPAYAQVDNTGSTSLVLERTVSVPDPCHVGQTISFRAKFAILEATDIGSLLQGVKVRVRMESDRDQTTTSTDFDLRGEGEANFLTLVSNSALGQKYSLPLTAEISTDTTSELVRTPYGDVLYNATVNLDPSAKETISLAPVSESCAAP